MLGASRRSRANRKKHFFVSQRCEAPKNATSTLLLGEGGRQGGDGGEWQELLFSQTPVTCGTCCHIMITPICVRHLLGSPHSCCCLSSRAKSRDKDTCWAKFSSLAFCWVLVRSHGTRHLAGRSTARPWAATSLQPSGLSCEVTQVRNLRDRF